MMMQLRYEKAAQEWIEALPLGNGRLGAMVYGEPFDGRIQMNEESVVYGGPVDRLNPDAKEYFPKIRQLILDGKVQEAEELEVYALSGLPQSERPYQNLVDLEYHLKHEAGEISEYERKLDLETGVVTVSWALGEKRYRMEVLTSKEKDLMAVEFRCDRAGSLNLSVLMTRGRFYNRTGKADETSIFLDGDLGKEGSEFCVQAKACAEGGSVRVIGEHLVIRDADRVVLYVNGVTSFPYRREKITDCFAFLKEQLRLLRVEDYEGIKEAQIRRQSEIFSGSVLELNTEEELEALPVDVRLKRVSEGKRDKGLVALYYAFGRYLLAASSQPGGLPANLQGIWCEKLEPTWDSKYTININTEMNYWPAEICNLSECHEPLFDLLERMVENGRRTAKEMYGCRGFVAHHNTDVWADTGVQDLAVTASYWVMGGAWIATHIWKRYCYTLDKEFLERMYPVLKECILFFLDFLVEKDGYYVICPSISPENTYIMENGETGRACVSSTMDNAILKDIFVQFLETEKALGKDSGLGEQVRERLEHLPGFQIGKHGQLMEWQEDYEEWEIGHRHFSHLYAMFPSNQINEYDSPELVEACRKSLERRMKYGGGHTGWSCAWLIALYARLQDGDKAREYIDYLLSKLTAPNMFDLHPPLERISGIPWVFQIDGNLGGSCGIAQMFLQSHLDELFLLPALPQEWEKGSMTGLCAQGGFTVDLHWDNHHLTKAVLLSKHGKNAVIRCGESLHIETENGESISFQKDEKGRLVFPTRAGMRYILSVK